VELDDLIADGEVSSIETSSATFAVPAENTLTVEGDENVIGVQPGSILNLTGAWNAVYGSDAQANLTSAQVEVNGDDDTIDFAGGSGNIEVDDLRQAPAGSARFAVEFPLSALPPRHLACTRQLRSKRL
jgi:hypothetical protein